MANCPLHHHLATKEHLNNLMRKRPLKKLTALLGAAALFLFSGLAKAQEKPDRPPWAQPAGAAQTKPADAPPKEKQEPATSRNNTIKVNVNLVNVLVSVLDDKNRPAPDLPVEAFQVFE